MTTPMTKKNSADAPRSFGRHDNNDTRPIPPIIPCRGIVAGCNHKANPTSGRPGLCLRCAAEAARRERERQGTP